MELLRAEHITKIYDGRTIIEDISVDLRRGEMVSLLGLSGSGKTTLFQVLSGLSEPEEGHVFLRGREITGQPGKISYMLQKDLLLPHKKVIDNVALPLVLAGVPKKRARLTADPYFQAFGLAGTQLQYPAQLSGGMRQRAALLRTYLSSLMQSGSGETDWRSGGSGYHSGSRQSGGSGRHSGSGQFGGSGRERGRQPDGSGPAGTAFAAEGVALLDEPFSALDSITKEQIHEWYLDVMEKIHLTTLLITHDIDEAILLSDRIYIMTGRPGVIRNEISIGRKRQEREGFTLTPQFLAYKKQILEILMRGKAP